MKKLLIATENKEKFKIVSWLLRKTGLTEENYQILSLKDINYNGPDKKEVGDITQRARIKSETVKQYFSNATYDYFVGIDDGIILKGQMIENVKEHLKKILYENYLSDGEEIIFPRAYYIVGRNNDEVFQEVIEIPYVYMPRNNACIKEFSYPLSQVSAPIGYDRPIAELTTEEANNYYWKYSKLKMEKLIKNIK